MIDVTYRTYKYCIFEYSSGLLINSESYFSEKPLVIIVLNTFYFLGIQPNDFHISISAWLKVHHLKDILNVLN